MPGDPVEAVAALRQAGARITAPRRALIEALAACPEHPSAEDLVARLQADDAGVHRATVYRTLDFLVRAGVVAHVHLPHGATAYHLVGGEHRVHAHLVCRGCGEVLDVPDLLEAAAGDVRRQLGFRLDVDHVALTGWCAACDPASSTGRAGRPARGYGGPMDEGLVGLLGIEVVDMEDDGAAVELEAGEQHLNPHGTVHGGAIATLVDTAMGAAVRREDTGDEAPVTIEMTITYLEPAMPGRLRAEATIRRRGRRIVIAEVDVLDADGQAVAHGIGTFTSVSGS